MTTAAFTRGSALLVVVLLLIVRRCPALTGMATASAAEAG
jgi:hypothetical protein